MLRLCGAPALALACGVLLLFAMQQDAYAATFIVNTAVDEFDGECVTDCSLRDAIALATNGDAITFSDSYTIYLNSELGVNKTVTIDGSGYTVTVSGDSGGDGSRNVRVFSIGSSGVVTLTHLSIVSGTATDGGGIHNLGAVIVENSTFSGNTASTSGGGMYNYAGSPTLTNVTFSDNTATNDYGGGMSNEEGDPALTNVTFSGNSATTGGGMYNYISSPVLTDVTFHGNTATTDGGGMYNYISNPTLTNVIIADSSSGGDCVNCISTLNAASSNNLIEDAVNACGLTNGANGNIIGSDPALDPTLADNGGSTQTHALLAGSPAINAGTNTGCPATDQRGMSRPQGAHCDIGAFEASAEIAVLGNNTEIADGDATPSTADHTDFGGVPLGQSLTRTFTISNNGALDLTLTGSPIVSLSGDGAGDFSVAAQPATSTVASNTTTTFQICFTPSVTETRVATVTIANNDHNENPYVFAIRGLGAAETGAVSYLPLILKNAGP